MLANTCAVYKKCLTPLFQRFLVMAAHDLNIGDFAALSNGSGGHLSKRRQIAAGEDIFVDPPIAPAGLLAERNRMDKRQPADCE